MNKTIIVFLLLGLAAVFAQTTANGPVVAPSACPTAQPPTAGLNITCQTTDPISPVYISQNGGAYQQLTPSSTVTSVNGRTGAVKIPQAGATLQCTSITGTITIGAAGAVTITNAVGSGCNF